MLVALGTILVFATVASTAILVFRRIEYIRTEKIIARRLEIAASSEL